MVKVSLSRYTGSAFIHMHVQFPISPFCSLSLATRNSNLNQTQTNHKSQFTTNEMFAAGCLATRYRDRNTEWL
jgi:hypothetical protein